MYDSTGDCTNLIDLEFKIISKNKIMKYYFNFKKKIKMSSSKQKSNNIIWVCSMCTEDTQNCYCIFVSPIGIDAYRIATLRDYCTRKEICEILLKGKLDLIKHS